MQSITNTPDPELMNPTKKYKMPWIMAQLGSGLAAILGFGIATAAVFLLIYTRDNGAEDDLAWATYLSLQAAVVVFFVWLAILMPIYRRIPPESWIWKWPYSTLLGATTGELVMLAFSANANSGILLHHFHLQFLFLLMINYFAIWGISLGGSIGLVAGLTHSYFRKS